LSQVIFSLSLFLVCLFFLLFSRKRYEKAPHPEVLVLLSFSLCLVYLGLSTIWWNIEFSLFSFSIILSFLMFLILGFRLGNVFQGRGKSSIVLNYRSRVIFSIIGMLIYASYASYSLIQSGLWAQELSAIRVSKLANRYEGSDVMLSIARSCFLVTVPVYIFLRSSGRGWIKRVFTIFFVLSSALFVLEGVLSATRMNILILILIFVLSLSVQKHGSKKYNSESRSIRLLQLSVLIAAGWLVLVAIPAARNTDMFISGLNFYLARSHSAELNEMYLSDNGVFSIVVYSLRYLSIGIVKLIDLINSYDYGYWAFEGYNIKVFTKVFSFLGFNTGSDWLGVREAYQTYSNSLGYNDNPWKTLIGDLVIDFGLLGGLLIISVLGFAASSIFWTSSRRSLLMPKVMSVYLTAGLLCAPFFGFLVVNILIYPTVLSLSLFFIGCMFTNARSN
jgi:hypothetical protein